MLSIGRVRCDMVLLQLHIPDNSWSRPALCLLPLFFMYQNFCGLRQRFKRVPLTGAAHNKFFLPCVDTGLINSIARRL